MDPELFRAAYARLERLDERHAYKLRSRTRAITTPPSPDQVERQLRDLTEYTLELRQIVGELFEAISARPKS